MKKNNDVNFYFESLRLGIWYVCSFKNIILVYETSKSQKSRLLFYFQVVEAAPEWCFIQVRVRPNSLHKVTVQFRPKRSLGGEIQLCFLMSRWYRSGPEGRSRKRKMGCSKHVVTVPLLNGLEGGTNFSVVHELFKEALQLIFN